MTSDSNENFIVSKVYAFKQEIVLACDGKCEKAWGINERPVLNLDPNDENDIAWLSDLELGPAPTNPCTCEGGVFKPLQPIHNKWCFSECERSVSCLLKDFPNLQLPNFSQRVYNQPQKHVQS